MICPSPVKDIYFSVVYVLSDSDSLYQKAIIFFFFFFGTPLVVKSRIFLLKHNSFTTFSPREKSPTFAHELEAPSTAELCEFSGEEPLKRSIFHRLEIF